MKLKTRIGTFEEFQAHTLAIARGEHKPSPDEPKIWIEATDSKKRAASAIRFHSLEAGAKLLSPKNRDLLRLIAKRKPRSISALAEMSGRAEQNLLRTLRKMTAAGIVRLERGEGRAYSPKVIARKVLFEVDLLGR